MASEPGGSRELAIESEYSTRRKVRMGQDTVVLRVSGDVYEHGPAHPCLSHIFRVLSYRRKGGKRGGG